MFTHLNVRKLFLKIKWKETQGEKCYPREISLQELVSLHKRGFHKDLMVVVVRKIKLVCVYTTLHPTSMTSTAHSKHL